MNISVLKILFTKHIGGHLTLLGEIPDDPSMQRAVRSYLPVVECEPASPATVALKTIADNLVKYIGEGQSAHGWENEGSYEAALVPGR